MMTLKNNIFYMNRITFIFLYLLIIVSIKASANNNYDHIYDNIIDKFNKCLEENQDILSFNHCNYEKLGSFDKILNKSYNDLIVLVEENIDSLEDSLDYHNNLKEDIIKSQTSWEEYTDNLCNIIMIGNGTTSSLFFVNCKIEKIIKRIEELDEIKKRFKDLIEP